MSELHVNQLVDARQQPCPMPILMLKRALKTLPSGQIILIKSTDPHSQQDLVHFCQVQQLKLLKTEIQNDEFHYYIEN
ncbi:MAG: sulfurtransferase TusA family protein [Acinetobacter populi]|jgi:tRNA 2-thiouridine synthesizing protein A|uniref:sulfurtransferase TusA family protein n=1 Tax=Acinetobacter populi TaxID=1582270 RepID=UPI002356F502|nr:sulfurtransferase TusA family protein [Acinetobacter populi]MCH4247326.1 sulfurtransferase TusA family protein [Acinetobacter populi]